MTDPTGIADKLPLNYSILREPANWIILTLMVAIVALGLSLIFHVETPALPVPK